MLIPFNYLLFIKKKVKGVIHIGAHELEELKYYLSRNIKKIIWIEANPEKYPFLEEKLSLHNQMLLGKFAAGSIQKKANLNISNNGESSSILDLGTHKESYPNIFYKSKTEVKVMPVDTWLDENINIRDQYNFLNIDIQGYELEALKGMERQLKYIDYIYLEVNYRQVYKKCSELKDIDKFLNKFNFKRVGMKKTRHGWGDAIYSKNFKSLYKAYYFFLMLFLSIYEIPFYIQNIYKRIKKIC